MWRKRIPGNEPRERVVKDRERSRKRTMDRAVRLLAAKPRSILELRDRLLEKLWTDEELVDGVIEKLKEYKYLDDEQYASTVASSKLRARPQGRRRLEHDMSRKKLDRAIIDKAIAEAFEKLPEAELIDTAIEKRVRLRGVPQTREDTKKLLDHLLRRGFSFDLIREKVRELKAPDDDD